MRPVRLYNGLRQISRNGLAFFPQVDFDQARPQPYDKIDEAITAPIAGIGRNHLRHLIRPFNRRMRRETLDFSVSGLLAKGGAGVWADPVIHDQHMKHLGVLGGPFSHALASSVRLADGIGLKLMAIEQARAELSTHFANQQRRPIRAKRFNRTGKQAFKQHKRLRCMDRLFHVLNRHYTAAAR